MTDYESWGVSELIEELERRDNERSETIANLAHAYTREECNKLGLKIERFEEGTEYYTDEAQDIYNRHHDFIENNL